jgi:tetratricopeptide (TPR) repeat protein
MSEFEYYGQKLDLILRKIASLPQIQELLNNKRAENSFSSQFILLASLRDRILKHLPKRIQDEKKILFTEILNEDWNITHEVHGSELLFTILDSIILSKFGFENNCVIVNNSLFLEVITSEKVIYWEPLTYSPISYYTPAVSFRSDFLYFFAATMIKIADVHYQLGRDLEKAIGLYEKAIYLNPDFSTTYVNLAQVHIKVGSIKQAIIYLEKAIEINPRSAEYYHMLGFAYCLIRKWSNAIYALKTAISLRSTYIEALNNLAYAYEQDGDLHRAEEIYNQILSFKPNYFDAHFGLGNVYFNLKQYQRAIVCFERALKIIPYSEHAYYNLAQTYFELGELDSSIKTYKQLLRFKPNHATAWYNLGIIYRNKGMKKEAVKCIEQAVRTDPKLMK